MTENVPLAFSGGAAPSFGVIDSDAGIASEQVAIVGTSGTLQMHLTTGLMFSAGSAAGSQRMVFTGTLANINADLNGLVYVPIPNFSGTGAIFISVDDLGHTGTGGAMTAWASVAIKVLPPFAVSTTNDVADGDTSSITALLNNPGPDGLISLREALLAANNTPGTSTIMFDIPGGGVHTISVLRALPQVNTTTIIDGTTQPGYTSSPLIELNGQGAPLGTNGLLIGASNSTVARDWPSMDSAEMGST